MAFTEIDLVYIKKTIGKMCERRSPPHLRNELRTVYEVKGYDVIVYEERPQWNDPEKWSREPIAKFKYIRKDDRWKLYWMRGDLKWHPYEMKPATKSLGALVKEVDTDPHGAFWG